MVTEAQVVKHVKKSVADVLDVNPDKIVMDKSLEDYGIDEINRNKLKREFEDVYRLKISDEEAEKLTTVKAYIDYIMLKAD